MTRNLVSGTMSEGKARGLRAIMDREFPEAEVTGRAPDTRSSGGISAAAFEVRTAQPLVATGCKSCVHGDRCIGLRPNIRRAPRLERAAFASRSAATALRRMRYWRQS